MLLNEDGFGCVSVMPARSPVPEINDLLTRFASGDEWAFAALYGAVRTRVWGLIRRVVRDPAQVEEVFHEVMLQVWHTAGRFDTGQGSAVGWVSTIAHRRAVDRVRSEQVSAGRLRRHAVRNTDRPYDDVVESANVNLERQQVIRCLAELPELQREAITLAYYGGHTYSEVAELLDTALPTIKSRIRDGLRGMRGRLA